MCSFRGRGRGSVSVRENGLISLFLLQSLLQCSLSEFLSSATQPNSTLHLKDRRTELCLIVKTKKNSISLHLILKFSNSQGWYLWKWEPRVPNIINDGEGRDRNRTKLIISGNPCGDQKFGNDDNQWRCASEKTVDKDNPSIFGKICYHQVCLNIYHLHSIKHSAMLPRMLLILFISTVIRYFDQNWSILRYIFKVTYLQLHDHVVESIIPPTTNKSTNMVFPWIKRKKDTRQYKRLYYSFSS